MSQESNKKRRGISERISQHLVMQDFKHLNNSTIWMQIFFEEINVINKYNMCFEVGFMGAG